MTTYQRFVALGDSVTEGSGDDPHPDGTSRGWADRLAARLAVDAPDLQYANLAVWGRLTRAVRIEQLAAARALAPDLAAIAVGMNDLLRPRFDLPRVAGDLDAMVTALRGDGATVLTMTFPDLSAVSPVGRLLRTRILGLNAAVRAISVRRGALLCDVRMAASSGDARLWSVDRLHLNADGHALLATAMGSALGLPDDGAWRRPLPPAARRTVTERIAIEAAWVRQHAAPWVGRRLRGVSHGDLRPAKRPALAPVTSMS